jgi:hypothetical protein
MPWGAHRGSTHEGGFFQLRLKNFLSEDFVEDPSSLDTGELEI